MLLEMQHLLKQDETLMLHNEQHPDYPPPGGGYGEARPHRPALPHDEIQAGADTVTAAGPMPAGLRDVLDHIDGRSGVH
jgi:hypothetical protein